MKAFPYNPQFNQEHNGMDLRDYFAGQVLSCVVIDDTNIHGSATFCYRVADAMMKARQKKDVPYESDFVKHAKIRLQAGEE